MALRFIDQDPDDSALAADQMLGNVLGMAERQAQEMTSRANGSAEINRQIAHNLVDAGQRPVA